MKSTTWMRWTWLLIGAILAIACGLTLIDQSRNELVVVNNSAFICRLELKSDDPVESAIIKDKKVSPGGTLRIRPFRSKHVLLSFDLEQVSLSAPHQTGRLETIMSRWGQALTLNLDKNGKANSRSKNLPLRQWCQSNQSWIPFSKYLID